MQPKMGFQVCVTSGYILPRDLLSPIIYPFHPIAWALKNLPIRITNIACVAFDSIQYADSSETPELIFILDTYRISNSKFVTLN